MRTFRSSWFLVVLSLALVGMPLSADGSALADLPPFVDSVTYSVPGTLLNQWMKDSQKQDADLRAALEQVKISQTSFGKYKKQVVAGDIVIALTCFLFGGAAGYVISH
jgi:hypothetical protein